MPYHFEGWKSPTPTSISSTTTIPNIAYGSQWNWPPKKYPSQHSSTLKRIFHINLRSNWNSSSKKNEAVGFHYEIKILKLGFHSIWFICWPEFSQLWHLECCSLTNCPITSEKADVAVTQIHLWSKNRKPILHLFCRVPLAALNNILTSRVASANGLGILDNKQKILKYLCL